jgi:hypothetical protein
MDTPRDLAQATLVNEENFKDLSDIDPNEHVLKPSRRRARSLLKVFIGLTLALLLTTALYFKFSTPKPFDQCGTTASEARARGCVFETTGFAWLPKACHDADTEAEFLAYISANNLTIHRDNTYSSLVPLDEVRLGEGPGFYVRQQYHLTHCLFLLKKLHRALHAGRMVDGMIEPLGHTEHCVGQLLKPKGFREHDVGFSYTKFPYCGRPGGYNVHWEKLGQWTDY